jgi:MerR family transcriptional regulator, copper efflux regulator
LTLYLGPGFIVNFREVAMKTLTIGKLAEHSKVHVETVRYYERRGLIPRPPRRDSGYRQFPLDTVRRVRFIKHAQEVGFTLKEIQELLSLRVDPRTTCADIRERAETKISEVEKKIQALQAMKEALVQIKASCKGRGPSTKCPILDALDSNNVSSRRQIE